MFEMGIGDSCPSLCATIALLARPSNEHEERGTFSNALVLRRPFPALDHTRRAEFCRDGRRSCAESSECWSIVFISAIDIPGPMAILLAGDFEAIELVSIAAPGSRNDVVSRSLATTQTIANHRFRVVDDRWMASSVGSTSDW